MALRNMFGLITLESTQILVKETIQDLKRYFLAITKLNYDSSGQLRMTGNIGTVTTVTTVAAVTTV